MKGTLIFKLVYVYIKNNYTIQSMKLRIMISSVQAKVMVRFEASEMMCTELRAKKL